MTKPELKPCPWCDTTDFLFPSIDKQYEMIVCEKCYGQGPISTDNKKTIELWNTRPGEKG